MNLKKLSLIITIALPLFISGHALAGGMTTTGYLTSVTPSLLVMDGVSYRFRPNQEERNPVEVRCEVKDKAIGCEELARIDWRNSARAKISIDTEGFVTRVQVLDVLK
jgi:hypothetical protein